MSTIELQAVGGFGYEGRQYIARITGRDPKVQFKREFVGRRSGRRNETTSFVTDEGGLFETCFSNKRGKIRHYMLILPFGDRLVSLTCELQEALVIAKRLGAGEPLESFVVVETGDPVLVSEYRYSCTQCGAAVSASDRCVEHPTATVISDLVKVPKLRADGSPVHELIYVLLNKTEVKSAKRAATLDTAVAEISAALRSISSADRGKAIKAARERVAQEELATASATQVVSS
jgi:hypothetical protein